MHSSISRHFSGTLSHLFLSSYRLCIKLCILAVLCCQILCIYVYHSGRSRESINICNQEAAGVIDAHVEQPELVPSQQCPTTNKHNPETKKVSHWLIDTSHTIDTGLTSSLHTLWKFVSWGINLANDAFTDLSLIRGMYLLDNISWHIKSPAQTQLIIKKYERKSQQCRKLLIYTYTVYLLPSFWAAKTTFCRSISPLLWKIERKTCFVSTWLGSQYHRLTPC